MDTTRHATANSSLTFHVAVDGGGSSCVAALVSTSGVTSIGVAGPCNVSTIGIGASMDIISEALDSAIAKHSEWLSQEQPATISSAWVGLAGYDRPSLTSQTNRAVSALFKIPLGPSLTVTSDTELLMGGVYSETSAKSAIVLVIGTGSVAMSYKTNGDGEFHRTARMGGWGPLLGDDGSGFSIGKRAIRIALRESDRIRAGDSKTVSNKPISQAIFGHFRERHAGYDTEDLLSAVLTPRGGIHPPTKAIAEAARVVLSLAEAGDNDAKELLQQECLSIVELISDLLKCAKIQAETTALVTAGGLTQNRFYRTLIFEEFMRRGIQFAWSINVGSPAIKAASWLASQESQTHKTL